MTLDRSRRCIASMVAVLAAIALLLSAAASASKPVDERPLSLEEASSQYGIMAPGLAAAVPESTEPAPSNGTSAAPENRRMLQGGCSNTDSSADAVFACTNAVRQNPSIMSDASCYNSIKHLLTDRRRNALNRLNNLESAARNHNNLMIQMDRMEHRLPGEADLGPRVSATGYSWAGIAENIAMGQGSARQVVMSWLCSSGHRENMFSCDYTDLGVAAGRRSGGSLYYTQVFGCPRGSSCNSCGNPNPDPNPPPNVVWLEIRPTHIPSNNFCVDIRGAAAGDGVVVQQYRCNKTPAQRFRLSNMGGNVFTIADQWGRCIDVPGSNTSNDVGLIMWQCHNGPNQQWQFKLWPRAGKNVYRIINRNSGKCMAIRNAAQNEGLQLSQWDCSDSDGRADQRFRLYNF